MWDSAVKLVPLENEQVTQDFNLRRLAGLNCYLQVLSHKLRSLFGAYSKKKKGERTIFSLLFLETSEQ